MAVGLSLMWPTVLSAANFTVLNNLDGSGLGPPGSLRLALSLANTAAGADTIVFDPSFFSTPRTIVLTAGNLAITGPTTITGPGANRLTISGNNASRIFIVNSGLSVTMSGLTLENGNADYGGLIYNVGSLTLTGCALRNSTATQGGAIQSSGPSLTLTNCEVSGNSAANFGGGIEIVTFGATISASLENVTLSGNFTTGSNYTGGAVECYAVDGLSFVTLKNCTLADNAAPMGADGLYVGQQAGASQATIRNSLFSNLGQLDISADVEAVIASLGNNLSRSATSFLTHASDIQGVDPFLRPLALNGGTTRTHALGWPSPAIDHGSNAGVSSTDQRGLPRSVAASCGGAPATDIGAFEVQRYVVSNLNDYGGGSLRRAVDDNELAGGGGVICIPLTGTVHFNTDTLTLNKDVTILGPSADTLTLSGENLHRVLLVTNNTRCYLEGATIANGREPTSSGGAIQIESASLTLRNCAVINSMSDQGGGILNSNGTLIMENCELSGNSATSFGGGLLSISQGVATTSTLINTTICNNHSDNGSTSAGGILSVSNTSTQITNLSNCTVADNTGPSNGGIGGILSWSIAGSCTLNLKNTIVARNSELQGATAGPGIIVSQGHNMISDASLALGAIGDKLNTDPQLSSLGDHGGPTYTCAIGPDSPAVNAGDPTGAPVDDQRGLPRIQGCAIDIGAVELQSGAAGSGDFDGGGVAPSDVAPFVNELLKRKDNQTCIADVNGDGTVNARDIQEFVWLMTAP